MLSTLGEGHGSIAVFMVGSFNLGTVGSNLGYEILPHASTPPELPDGGNRGPCNGHHAHGVGQFSLDRPLSVWRRVFLLLDRPSGVWKGRPPSDRSPLPSTEVFLKHVFETDLIFI